MAEAAGMGEATGSLNVALERTERLLQVNPILAAEQAAEILKAVPGHPAALLLLGVAQRMLGNAVGALELLQPLCIGQPRWAAAQFELGMTYTALGERGSALTALRHAVLLKPQLTDAWREIGDQLTANGDVAGADAAYAQFIKASTHDTRLLAAAHALCNNDIPNAELRLRDHLKQHPTDVAALRMLAEVAGRLGRNQDAAAMLERCLQLAPSFDAARHNYALVLYRQNKCAAALLQIEALTAKQPRNAGYDNLKAVVLAKIGDYQESIDLYASVLERHPAQAKIWLSYGHALSTAGRLKESIAAYRRCIELAPDSGEAYFSLANLKTFRFDDAAIADMQGRLATSSLSDDDRAHFHFAIGKALEDGRHYQQSFDHYAAANEFRRRQVGYRAADTTAAARRSGQLFTADFFAARAGFGARAADPIFVVGLPRAGSTLIEQILASHSQVEGTMELPDLMQIANGVRSYPEGLADLSAAQCRALGEQYLAQTRIQRKTEKPFFIDKMPNNCMHLGLIRLILPNAKIIDARRHPMACCFSGFKQTFAKGQRFTYSLEDIGRYYRDYVELMTHFDRVLPGFVHRALYEAMIDDTEAQVRSLLAYCRLPFEEPCLRFYENERAVRTASAHQVRQPIFREGVDQWRHYESWLVPLRSVLGDVLAAYPASPPF